MTLRCLLTAGLFSAISVAYSMNSNTTKKIEKLCETYSISDLICTKFILEANNWFIDRLTTPSTFTSYPISNPQNGSEFQELRICKEQRPEDAVAQYFYDNDFYGVSMEDGTRKAMYDFLCHYYDCDGKEPRSIIGRLTYSFVVDDVDVQHSTFYLRDMYNPIFHADCIGSQMFIDSITPDMIFNDVLDELIAAKSHYYMNNVAVSLGTICHTSVEGVKLKLRKTKSEGYNTGPFDLMFSNYEGIIQCLLDDFKYFSDSSYLHLMSIPISFLSLEKLGLFAGDTLLYNSKYNFLFPHDVSPAKYRDQQWSGGPEHFIVDDFKFFNSKF